VEREKERAGEKNKRREERESLKGKIDTKNANHRRALWYLPPHTEITLRQHPETLKDSKDIPRIEGTMWKKKQTKKQQRTIKVMGIEL